MIQWLDFLIFGNGRGMSQPYFDGAFYWLKDAYNQKSEFYTFSPGFGAQLRSFQWRHPRAGEHRRLLCREFRIFHSRRRWFRVECVWGMHLPDDLNKATAEIRIMHEDLTSLPIYERGKPE